MRIDRTGGMPFAVVAVALLLASASMAAVVHQYGDAGEGAGGAAGEVDAVDAAIAGIEVYVNRGLGGIVGSISTDESGGTVSERAERFAGKAAEWLEFQFPVRNGGTVAHLVSYDVSLTAEPLVLASETDTGGYTPGYLRGTGTVRVEVESQSGRGEAELTVSTDGSYALPLAADRLSLFERMAGSGGVSVSQMMTYQLTALAQKRVMDGYGSVSAHGETGTSAILTSEDVAEAYRIALEAVRMICFRDGNGEFAEGHALDPADILAADNGLITLDLSEVYAQALMSVVDDVALKWFDYFCGFEVLDALDRVLAPFTEAVDSLMSYIRGGSGISAAPYLDKAMEAAGIPASEYSRPGSGTSSMKVGDVTVTVENPTVNILETGWISDFKYRYDRDTNFVMEFILGVLRQAALDIAGDTGLGTVSAKVDPNDGTSYMDTLTYLFSGAVSDGEAAVASAISDALGSSRIPDPFLGAIADEIAAHSRSMMLSDELRSSLADAYLAAAPEGCGIEELEDSGELDRAVRDYEALVMNDIGVFDVLRHADGEASVAKRVLVEICSFGLDLLGVTDPVPERMSVMCTDILEANSMNSLGGVVEMPGTDRFLLDDGSGNITAERLEAEVSGNPAVGGVTLDRDMCIHNVGFGETTSAAYTTVFTVWVSDLLDVRVEGYGALADAMGSPSSVAEGTVAVDTVLQIAVASGWALSGVEYNQSNTFYGDLWALLLEILEPLIEPLRAIAGMVGDVMTVISQSLMDALAYVSQQMVRVYEAVMGPLSDLKGWFEAAAESLFAEAALEVLFSIALDEQKVTFVLFGCTLVFSTDAVTWTANTKTLLSAVLTVPVAGLVVTAGIHFKVRGEVEAENLIVTGSGGISGDGWSVDLKIDPLMRGGKYLVTVDGEVGDTDISVVAPKLESYREMGIALSDIPGLGTILSNIPVGGAKVGLDAGFSVKYSDPEDTGLIVNEFETNPAGEDSGHEWVELLNNSPASIDLDGYTLMAASDRRTKCMELSGTLGPGEFLVIYPDFTLVNSSGKYTSAGEAVVIADADGAEIERTPTKKDGDNDGRTWQRTYDGSTEWVFAEATLGRSNNTHPGSGVVSAEEMREEVWQAVNRAFDRVPEITDLETMQTYIQYLVRYTLEGLIDVVSGHIREASVYVSLTVSDLTSTVDGGVRIALRTDGDLVHDVLTYITGKVIELVLKADNPYSVDAVGMFAENIDLEVTFHAGVGFPSVLYGDDLPDLDLGVTFRTNLAGITSLAGMDTGRPEVQFGIRVIGIPEAALPSKLSAKSGMDQDLWLVMMTVRFAR